MYMPTWPAANAWLIVPQSSRKLEPIELSSQRSDCRYSSALIVPGLSIVTSMLPSSLSVCMRPPKASVSEVSIHPPVLFWVIWA